MKEIRIECTWRTTLRIEVEDDFEPTNDLSKWPTEALDQITPVTAEFVDWDVKS